MPESGRIGLEIMGRAVRQAGAHTDPGKSDAGEPIAGGPALEATDDDGDAPDSITVRYEAQDGGEFDCTGNPRAAGTTVTQIFVVDTDARTLTCTNAPGAAPVVVMDNIENMQITYGIDGVNGSSAPDGIIDSYMTLAEMAATTPPLTLSQAAAVRVSLLIRGPTPHVAAGNSQAYAYNGEPVTKTDGFLRQVYTSTFTVRNQAH